MKTSAIISLIIAWSCHSLAQTNPKPGIYMATDATVVAYHAAPPEPVAETPTEPISTPNLFITKSNIGSIAPQLLLSDPEGNTHNLHNTKATYTLLLFYNPDCPHCQEQLPMLQEVYNLYHDSLDLAIYAINTGNPAKGYTGNWINVNGTMEMAWAMGYDAAGTPDYYLLDQNKTILAKHFGAEGFKTFAQAAPKQQGNIDYYVTQTLLEELKKKCVDPKSLTEAQTKDICDSMGAPVDTLSESAHIKYWEFKLSLFCGYTLETIPHKLEEKDATMLFRKTVYHAFHLYAPYITCSQGNGQGSLVMSMIVNGRKDFLKKLCGYTDAGLPIVGAHYSRVVFDMSYDNNRELNAVNNLIEFYKTDKIGREKYQDGKAIIEQCFKNYEAWKTKEGSWGSEWQKLNPNEK